MINIGLVNKRIRIKCSIDSIDKSEDARYQVEFFEGSITRNGDFGKSIGVKILKGIESVAFIENSKNDIKFKLSNKVTFMLSIILLCCRFTRL